MEPKSPWSRSSWPPPNSPANDRLPHMVVVVILVSVVMLAIALLMIPAMSSSDRPTPVVHETSIGEVLTLVRQHNVKSASLQGNQVMVTTANGTVYIATREDGQPLTPYLLDNGVTDISVQPPEGTSWWSQIAQSIVPLVIVVAVMIGFFMIARRRLPVANSDQDQARAFGRSRVARFDASHPTVLFRDVAGVDEAKEELQEIVHFLRYPDRFTSMGARTPKGVLLIGPPGTGKTLLAKAVAGEADVAFFSISGSEFIEMYVGVGASRVRDLFNKAKAETPCIIFIDEIDAVGRTRNPTMTIGNDEREQTLNQLLVEMDGFDTHDNVVIMAATNRPDVLDPALLRPGRFDRQVMLGNPDVAGRIAILQVHATGKPLAPSVNLSHLAQQTAGFSGADLANLMNEGALLAARYGHDTITQQDLEESILRVVAGPERKSHVLSQTEKAIVAYHETGHAIVMRLLPGCDVVRKVSTVSRGEALGMTVAVPAEDRSLLRRTELVAKLAGLMGGRVAEELIMLDVTTGAAQDIKQATMIARRMVCEFGMSPLGNLLIGDDGAGPQLAARADDEVASLVDNAYRTAKTILLERRNELVRIAEHLMRVETIDGTEFDTLLFAEEEPPAQQCDDTADTLASLAHSADVRVDAERDHITL